MADLNFYKEVYLGTQIPDSAFPQSLKQAEDALSRLRRVCRVSGGPVQEDMALCAMAEAVYQHGRQVSYAQVGNVTVRYENSPSLEGELYRRAGIYLDLYRGVH